MTSESELAEELRQAERLRLDGLAEQATARCRAILQQRPDCSEALYHLGLSLAQAGPSDEAVSTLERVVEDFPNRETPWLALADLYSANEEPEQATVCWQRAAEIRPAATTFNNLGVGHARQGELDAAVGAFEAALRIEPDSVDAHINLGRARFQMDQMEAAANAFRSAAQLAPDDMTSCQGLALALRSLGRMDEALLEFQRLVALQPSSFDAWYQLGLTLSESDQREQAAEALTRAVEREPEHPLALYNLGTVLAGLERLPEAAKHFERAALLDPTHGPTFQNLANACAALNQLERAAEALRTLLTLQPADIVYEQLVSVLLRDGREEDAKQTLHEWLSAAPDHPIALHLLSAWTGETSSGETSSGASHEYVRAEFDRFAETFEEVLQRLEYQAPQHIAQAVAAWATRRKNQLDILDAGCGTGLCGELLRPMSKTLHGVDLSEQMLEKARNREIYDLLASGELTEYLLQNKESYDVVVAGDTLVYFGDLAIALPAAFGALRSGGLFVFTVEVEDAQTAIFRLNANGRYTHRQEYVDECLQAAGFANQQFKSVELRKESRRPVNGLLASAEKPA